MALKLEHRSRSTAPPPDATSQRFRRRRRALRLVLWRRVLIVAAALSLVVGGIWLVFFSSVLAVSGTEVSGVSTLRSSTVVRVAQVPEGEPLATVDLAAIRARVEGLAPVASAEVTRAWPDQVRIEVTERVAIAAVDREGSWWALDADGVLFTTFPKKPSGLPEVRVKPSTSADALAEAAGVVDALPADVLSRAEFFDVRTIDRISFQLRGGDVVNWGSAEDSEAKARVLAVLLTQEGRVYDVTAPGRPTVLP